MLAEARVQSEFEEGEGMPRVPGTAQGDFGADQVAAGSETHRGRTQRPRADAAAARLHGALSFCALRAKRPLFSLRRRASPQAGARRGPSSAALYRILKYGLRTAELTPRSVCVPTLLAIISRSTHFPSE